MFDLFTQPDYHNTTKIDGEELELRKAKAKSEQNEVYEVFLKENKALCWSEVSDKLPGLLESNLKRCLSDLAAKKMLKKTKIRVVGKYKAKCFKYELVNQ